MPKLLIFAPCERVIKESDTNALSLISVMETIKVGVPDTGANRIIAIPFRWYVLVTWRREPGDEGKTYHQVCHLLGPDGERLQSFSSTFSFAAHVANIVALIPAFPVVRGGGEYNLVLYIREAGQEDPDDESGRYPINVTFQGAPTA